MKPHGLTLAIAGTFFSAAAGCQTASRCCNAWFAPAPASFADATPVPERVLTVSHSSESADSTSAGRSRADGTHESSADAKDDQATGETPRRFNIPSELPGANASPLTLPPMDESNTPEQKRSIAQSLFPDVKSLDESNGPDTQGEALTLTTLQQMAVDNSPVIRQAAADVEAARGDAVQRGLYPNPTIGYQGDTIGTARTAGYNGVFFSQEFVTAGKLTLAQNTALNQVRAAQADLRKARITLATDVRRSYFKVLIAQEQLRFSRAIARLTNEVYQAQIDLVAGGEAAPYEPLQLRVIAVQARNDVVAAKNGLDAAWRTLAAAVGLPHLQRQHVAGSVEHAIPDLDYQTLATMLQRHSDLIAANARIAATGCNLRLQEVTPIPNVTLYGAFQHDDTTPLSDYSTNVQLSAPVPVFDKNQGNIAAAHAQLVRARQDLNDINNRLMAQLADVFNRHQTSQTIAASYRTDLLPDQVRVYRGVYDRFLLDGESIDFAQVVVAQQTLTQVVNNYLTALSDSWMATVDLAELLQVDDIMTMDGMTLNGVMSTDVSNDHSSDINVPATEVPATEVPPAVDMLQGALESANEPDGLFVEAQSRTKQLQSGLHSTLVTSNITVDAKGDDDVQQDDLQQEYLQQEYLQQDHQVIEPTEDHLEPIPVPAAAQPNRRTLSRPRAAMLKD